MHQLQYTQMGYCSFFLFMYIFSSIYSSIKIKMAFATSVYSGIPSILTFKDSKQTPSENKSVEPDQTNSEVQPPAQEVSKEVQESTKNPQKRRKRRRTANQSGKAAAKHRIYQKTRKVPASSRKNLPIKKISKQTVKRKLTLARRAFPWQK